MSNRKVKLDFSGLYSFYEDVYEKEIKRIESEIVSMAVKEIQKKIDEAVGVVPYKAIYDEIEKIPNEYVKDRCVERLFQHID